MCVGVLPLNFIVCILSACSASGACVERIFSEEGNIHDKIHNRADPISTEARVKIKGNHLVQRKLIGKAFVEEIVGMEE